MAMNLHIIGSGSSGNCYVLEADGEALLIEAGERYADVKKALRWNVGKLVGCIVSHRHGDHAKYVSELLSSGVKVLATADVFEAWNVTGNPFGKVIASGHGYRLGGFKVLALEAKHDVPCLSFVVSHPEMGKLLFVTDSVSFNYRIDGLNTVMIEANYADDILDRNIAKGTLPVSMRSRLLTSHMELSQTIRTLTGLNLDEVDRVILLHLSDGNSDEARFVREVEEATGVMTYAADGGMKLDISVEPF